MVGAEGGLQNFLARVRRRYLWNLILEQAMIALAVAAGAVVLLLVVGTQILDWYWPVLLAAVALGFGIYRTLRKVPPLYRLAQIADHRLNSHDSISTAWYFSREQAQPSAGPNEILQVQRRQAESIARNSDPRMAFPFAMPRAIYATAILGMLAFTMIGVRYGFQHSLDLRHPIVDNLADLFRRSNDELAQQKREESRFLEDRFKEVKVPVNAPEGDMPGDGDENMKSAMSVAEVPDAESAAQTSDARDQSDLQQVSQEAEDGEMEGESGEPTAGDPRDAQKSEQSDRRGGQQNAQSQTGEESSLLQKMRDAMANLMSKLKIPQEQRQGNQSRMAQRKPGQQGAKQQQDGQPQSGQQQQSQGEGEPAEGQDGQKQGEGNQQAQNAQGNSSQQGTQRPDSPEARSGQGRDDGSKDLKEAEQQAAMGKLSEIIGKRAANIQGEVMVEVPSGKQSLRTRYSDRSTTHSEATGEIHRDEVPLILQPYVQSYFEEVRKTAPAKTPAPKE